MKTSPWILLANTRLTYKMQQKALVREFWSRSREIFYHLGLLLPLDTFWTLWREQGHSMKMRAFHVTLCQLQMTQIRESCELFIIRDQAPDSECHRRRRGLSSFSLIGC